MEQTQPPVFTPLFPLHHVHKIYQFSRTRKTEDMMETMVKQNKIPSVIIDDPFIESDMYKLSFCTKDFIEEWVRTTQILLFDQFQESIRNWTEITKGMKKEILSIKYERKKERHWRLRAQIKTRAEQIDCEKIRNLPNDILRLIWSFVDYEVQNKYYLEKYCYQEQIFGKMLQRLNFQTLKILYKKTAYCYHGLCMQKIIPSERYANPPVSKKTKQDFIRAIVKIMDDYLDMYDDIFVFTTHLKNGQLLSKKEDYHIEEAEYFGMVYPIEVYEKKTIQLWKHLAVAFSLFLPSDYYSYLCKKYYLPFPQPLKTSFLQSKLILMTTSPLPDSPPENISS